MKKIISYFLASFLILILIGVVFLNVFKTEEIKASSATFDFINSSSGYLASPGGTTYSLAHDVSEADSVSVGAGITVGQLYFGFPPPGTMFINRGGIFFDTSSLPDEAVISSAVLSISASGAPGGYGTIHIVDGSVLDYPTMSVSDYGQLLNKTTSFGSYDTTSGWTSGTYYNISLNTSGISQISKTGITKFAARSGHDINSVEAASDSVSFNGPKLTITYTVPLIIETSSASDITSDSATLNGIIVDDGEEAVLERGFDWGITSGSYTGSWTETGSFTTGTFSRNITGLSSGQKYYFRSKARNSLGWRYGGELFFTAGTPSGAVTETFYSSASDGFLLGLSSSYATAHNLSSASQVYPSWYIYVGQAWDGSSFQIYRTGLFFDTSSLPSDASIESAKISLYYPSSSWDNSTVDFNLTVVDGSGLSQPLELSNYGYLLSQTTSGGMRSTSGLPSSGYVDIDLNSTGLAWISKTGITKLGLRSSRDIYSQSPNSPAGEQYLEYVAFYDIDNGGEYPPKLTITYTSSGFDILPPTITNSAGATNVTDSSARLNGEIINTGGEDPTVTVYWGTDPNNWSYNESLGIKGQESFYKDISGLSPNTTYYYRFFAQNSGGSAWASSATSFVTGASQPGGGFTTILKPYPYPDFDPVPANPNLGVEIEFEDSSKCYKWESGSLQEYNCKTNSEIIYKWNFNSNEDSIVDCNSYTAPDSPCRGNATTSYGTIGTKAVELEITDELGNSCDLTKEIDVSTQLPQWKEIKPF